MAGHKHVAAMAEYAKDAAETDKPWERWQWSESPDDGRWIDCKVYEDAPIWHVSCGYRRKPRTLTIAGRTIEAPLCTAEVGQVVRFTAASGEMTSFRFQGSIADTQALNNGRLFATPEAAKAAYDAITALLTGKDAA